MSHLPLPKSPTSARGPAESPREPRQINTRFLCTALRRQAGHTVHSWKHPAASPAAKDAQAAAAHAGQVPGPTRKARRSPQGHPPPALSTLALLEEGSALPPTQWVPILLLPSELALSAPIWSMGWKNPKENSLSLEGQVEETDNQRQKSLVNG